jgi:hypothetical protein
MFTAPNVRAFLFTKGYVMYFLSPIGNDHQTDANGNPLVGGKIYTYVAGSSTPAATYTDSVSGTQQSNPIILNSLGLPASPIWMTGGVLVKFVIQDAVGVTIRTVDNVSGVNDVASPTTASEWVASGLVPTYISATSFSFTGDQTLVFQVGRRLLTSNTGGTRYSTITASVFSAGLTTITVKNDIGNLDAGLSAVSYGFLSITNPSGIGYVPPGTGSIARTVQAKLQETISVKDFGAIGNGVANDTVAIQAALNSGATSIFFPAGTYNIGQVTIPSTVKAFYGEGQGAVKFVAVTALANYQPYLNFNALSDFEIYGFSIDVPKATYPLNQALYLGTCIRGVVRDLTIIDTGFVGVYLPACQDVTVRDITFRSHGSYAVLAEANPLGLLFDNVKVLSVGNNHSIRITGGFSHRVENCLVNGSAPGCFCISSFGCSESVIANNFVRPTILEGIQHTNGGRVNILNNIVYCATSTHMDMGISLSAEQGDVVDCLVSGNTIFNSGAPGIGLCSDSRLPGGYKCERNTVSDNKVFNANRVNNANYLGIWVYGSLSQNNIVQNNSVVDQTTNVKYGTGEYNNGDGVPSFNNFKDNFSQCLGQLGEVLLLSATSRAWEVSPQTFTSVITSTSGTITTASGTGAYRRRGSFVEVALSITVTTNGTGAGSLRATTPLATIVNGTLNGRENTTSGLQVNGIGSGTSIIIRRYDNAYPAANGSTFQLSGIVEIT